MLLFAAALALSQTAQSGSQAALAAAQRHLQAQQWDSAVAAVRPVTRQEPGNARAWLLLGQAHAGADSLRAALAAYQHATSDSVVGPTALRSVGLAWARLGEPDSAFRWLRAAKATNRIDLTTLDLDSATVTLRDDPRYRALLPTAAEFADPFVEPVDIVHEWRGEAEGDQFGWIARSAGDVDGDGAQDVVVSAPTWGNGAGKIYVYSGRSGAELWSRTGTGSDNLGLSIERAGDVNGDGVQDVIAGAPGSDRALVYSGRDGGVLLDLAAPAAGGWFGRRVGRVGDADGDGHDDVAVGAPRSGESAPGAGTVYLYSGRDGRLLRTWHGTAAQDALGSALAGGRVGSRTVIVAGEPGNPRPAGGRVRVFDAATGSELFRIEADSSGRLLGNMFVSIVGDVNGDGVGDVWGTDFIDASAGPSTGKAYVHSGADGRRLLTLTGSGAGEGFGIGSAEAGDLNGDGHDDIVVGAWQYGGAAPSGGKIYVHSGRDGSLLWSFTGKVPGETLGFDATGVGDVNGDGTPDLLVTSAWSAANGARSGRTYVVSGRRPGR